ncbi:type I methionyl aminopeptidase [Pseudobacteriovorax antillogorgiicola]|uniref:Methionine aminopeptidase n=1 Tax=Pseudobacteriovorax antillogorgiicola TaxID=1513793 RepID=A0A1Y6B3E7_9BACT|nr:type I methionyl aminopeptidase [Pseudobacteriovorax antillogorgiicola]TCS59322.1 methionine aminopeptidase type I [Pseudobacteriovorax antillogorgiicola]SME89383.1 methionine aminopeptidase, type I [Pseudobacteriovorax antillogorgiicola]
MIYLKSDAEIDDMKEAGGLAAKLLELVEEHIKPGITTLELNDLCHDFTMSYGAISAPLNYKGFPKSICTSINDVVCHGIPSAKAKLKDGDIINVDVTPIVNGFHGDTSKTFLVGNVSPKRQKLVKVAKECLDKGIQVVEPGVRVGDIGAAIQKHAEAQKFSVVREFVGHGIGRNFHEDPQVTHYGQPGTGKRLEPGMVFTIEPMINEGHWKTKIKKDKWTAVTIDGGDSAQFEHTIAIRSNGTVEILTLIENYRGN